MLLEILTPEKFVFKGEVQGIILPGTDGLFEILNHHAPIVAALREGNAKILLDKSNTQEYKISSGFVEVLNNKATVLIEYSHEMK